MKELTQIFGIRAIIEAIKAGENINKVYIQKGLKGDLFSELENLLKTSGVNYSYVPSEKLFKLSKKNHQGAIAQISPIAFQNIETLVERVTTNTEKTPLFLILDRLTDVRNFGAIIRTADCAGVDGIFIQKKGAAPINADVVKTSAGAVFNIPICKVDHIKDVIYYLQASDINIIAATEKTDTSIYDVNFRKPTAIVMGAEDIGISTSVLKLVNEKAKLPLLGEIGSLNVSVACGAFLYEAVRQRML